MITCLAVERIETEGLEMKRLTFMIAVFVLVLSYASCAFCSSYNLYRNTEWEFSIDVPDFMSYKTPRGPNVKMSASNYDASFIMSVIVKPMPELEETDENSLEALHAINLQSSSDYAKCLKYGFLPIPNRVVLAEYWVVKHTYPERTFYQDAIMYSFVTNNKYFLITYYANVGTIGTYSKYIEHSIGSFVDETGWY